MFINYKLKSVAHLPWRAMVYKFLNTIIDDLFAFVIKMPTLHKLSVFRDDLIFVIYLYLAAQLFCDALLRCRLRRKYHRHAILWCDFDSYQRWAYRVDKKRANEYGLVAKDMEEDESNNSGVAKAEKKEQ